MESEYQDHVYLYLERVCDKVDDLFETYDTDEFIHHVTYECSHDALALHIIHYAFLELDSDDRINMCRCALKRDFLGTGDSVIIDTVISILRVLNDWENAHR
jgi:hypothetical protein